MELEQRPAIDFAKTSHSHAYRRAFDLWTNDDGDIEASINRLQLELVTSYVELFDAAHIAFRALLDVEELRNFTMVSELA